MFRIDSEGSTVDNKFTEGDPSLGVPATVVSADWLNHVQEEMAQFIEYVGITLDKLNDNQLQSALIEFFLRGGMATPLVQTLANNTGPSDVVGFNYDKTLVKCKIALFTIERKTDSQNVQESGILFVTYDSADDEWRPNYLSVEGDADVVFSSVVDLATDPGGDLSKLQYTTGDLTGGSYSGEVRMTSIFEIRA
jgi:hypothetical protein